MLLLIEDVELAKLKPPKLPGVVPEAGVEPNERFASEGPSHSSSLSLFKEVAPNTVLLSEGPVLLLGSLETPKVNGLGVGTSAFLLVPVLAVKPNKGFDVC